ncbi:MAG: hypothetical protein N3I35_14440 [Clostridia bacterium]|nr:hypothetical protein [Clostridia bacterium]
MPQVANLVDGELPEWVCNSIYSKLENPGLLDKKNIIIQKCFDPITAKSMIIAYANANKYDGAFSIFEDTDGKYKEIFGTRVKLIVSVQIRHPNIILASMDESGTGASSVNFHVIKNTSKGYKNVWQGLANFYDQSYFPQHCFEVTAGISFSDNGELIHSILKRIYMQGNQANPVSVEKLFDIYVYNESNAQYQFVKRL